MNSPRLGFYIISIGIIFQVFGLAGGSWMHDASSSGGVSLGGPSYALLILGMALIVAGTVLGSLSLSNSLTPTNGDTPRLLPLAPLVLLAAVSIGSGAFAFQASNNVSGNASAASPSDAAPLTPFVVATPGPNDCPEGLFWHPIMQHCMTPAAIAAYNANPVPVATPICPAGYAWQQQKEACVSSTGATAPNTGGVDPSCPDGFFWHPVMGHCMSKTGSCPVGYTYDLSVGYCVAPPAEPGATPAPAATPVCPVGTYWHPVMNHCMPTEVVCPVGYDYNPSTGYCAPPPTSTPPPNATPTPTSLPDTTPTPPDVTPEPTPACPDGFFWHPAMGHCMPTTCPPPLVLNPDTLYCELPPGPGATATPQPTATPTPTPPDATPEPTPACPDGYFWHPAMGHCMPTTCPPPLVLNPDTLYCELPGSSRN